MHTKGETGTQLPKLTLAADNARERIFFAAAQPQSAAFYTVGEAARLIGCSPSSVKRLCRELLLAVERTQTGTRLLTAGHVEKIRVELERRRMEAGR